MYKISRIILSKIFKKYNQWILTKICQDFCKERNYKLISVSEKDEKFIYKDIWNQKYEMTVDELEEIIMKGKGGKYEY